MVEEAQPGVEFDDTGELQEQFQHRTGKEVGINVAARVRKLLNLAKGPIASPPAQGEEAERVPTVEAINDLLDDYERRIKDGEFGPSFSKAGVQGIREALDQLVEALEKFEDSVEKLAPHLKEEEL